MNVGYEEERKKLQERIKRQEKKIMEKLEELEKDGCPISIKGIKILKDKKKFSQRAQRTRREKNDRICG